jgi:SP family arabinose:H+ symporter-like MFS transporter
LEDSLSVLILLFPVIASYSRPAPFVLFSAMMALQFFVVLLAYPETKGVTLQEIQKKLATT